MPIVQKENAEKLKKYFGGSGRLLPWLLIAIGIPLLFAFLIGVIPIAIGVWMLSKQSAPLPDGKVDQLTDEIMRSHDYVTRAREVSAFPELIREPILLQGLAPKWQRDGVFSGERFGDDIKLRATPMGVTVLLAAPDQLGIYQTGVDLITGNRVNEQFLEVFYQDVIGVVTVSQTKSYDLGEALKNVTPTANPADIKRNLDLAKLRKSIEKMRQKHAKSIVADILQWQDTKVYRIEFANGQHVEIVVGDGQITEEANARPFVSSDSETAQAMFALRTLVRDKKRGFLRKEIAG